MHIGKMPLAAIAALGIAFAAGTAADAAAASGASAASDAAEASRAADVGTGISEKADALVDVRYTKAQLREIADAYAKFPSFETPYAPRKMAKGDRYVRTEAGEDGVTVLFDHMRVYVSPRDYSDPAAGTAVTLPNGVQARWYAANEATGHAEKLVFPLDDRFVSLSSPDRTLTRGQLERVAVTVGKLK